MDLALLRQRLHGQAELSGAECATAATVAHLLESCSPDDIATGVGGHGVLAAWGASPPTVLVRCELDALPIPEGDRQASHRCGHDGHMAIVAGLALRLAERRPRSGRVVLAFQPAEETGAGATRLIADPAFGRFLPDRAFALHNLPGRPLGRVVVREGTFASASVGLRATLRGRSSHAGEPHKGHSPARAMARIVQELCGGLEQEADPGTLLTVVGARLGRGAFGTSPGEAEVSATLRAWTDADLDLLEQATASRIRAAAREHAHPVSFERVEPFPATVGDPDCVRRVRAAAERVGLSVDLLEQPFPWSEDFGHFCRLCPAALFGLGAGADTPALHEPDYVFPDALIEPGVRVLSAIIDDLLGGEEPRG